MSPEGLIDPKLSTSNHVLLKPLADSFIVLGISTRLNRKHCILGTQASLLDVEAQLVPGLVLSLKASGEMSDLHWNS